MSPATPQVDGYIRKNKEWKDELEALRALVLGSGLIEEVKWRAPCYTLDGANVAFLGAMKECCVLSFLKGALLKDPEALLEMPGENTQSARFMRFRDVTEITKRQKVIKAYLKEAIAVEKAGLKVKLKTIDEYEVPEELQAKFDEMPDFKAAFQSLTPGRQRAYLMHFSSAKQSATRTARIDKHIDDIFAGKGIDDDYRAKIKKK